MILARWLTDGVRIELGSPICELNIDGRAEEIKCSNIISTDYGGAVFSYVREGQEVGPSGNILEYSTNVTHGSSPRNNLHATARATLTRRQTYPSIFINYRQADTEAYAWRLHESLTQRYGRDAVFLDEFSIRPGEPYRWTLQQAVVHCKILICLIGPHWLSMRDTSAQLRIQGYSDLVRRELCAAMDRGTIVIPVITPRAEIPNETDLPDDLRGLEELQFMNLSSRRWEAESRDLCDALDQHLRQ